VVGPILEQGERILASGPGTLSIPADVVAQIAAQAGPDVTGVELVDGGIQVTTTVKIGGGDLGFGDLKLPEIEQAVTVTATPTVTNGQAGLDLGSIGGLAEATGRLDGLKALLEHLNTALADAGQQVRSISVTPNGIQVTTELIPR
jgi:hypothetical protein